jgi:hypothetical protein
MASDEGLRAPSVTITQVSMALGIFVTEAKNVFGVDVEKGGDR